MAELPVDHGYAWFVAIGAFINVLISLGTYRVYGVIFIEVLDYYDTSSALSSTMFGIFMLTCALSLVIHTVIVDKVTERTLGICAGVSFGLSLILQVFSPNVYYFITIFGIFGGIGSTFTLYTAIISLSTYFRKRLSLASGLAFTGSSIGQLVIPQLMELILNEYDLKGAMLILGGIQLHPIVSAMLFRPKSFYNRGALQSDKVKDTNSDDRSEVNPHTSVVNTKLDGNSREDEKFAELIKNKETDISTEVVSGDYNSQYTVGKLLTTADVTYDVTIHDKCSNAPRRSSEDNQSTVIVDSSSILHRHRGSLEDDFHFTYKVESKKNNRRKYSVDSVDERSGSSEEIRKLVLILDNDEFPKVLSLRKSLQRLCTSPRFFFFMSGRCFSVLAMYLVILFLPPYAIDNGCTMFQVTLMLSVVGACDLPSRPLHGWIVSFRPIDATYYVGITTFVASVIIFICIFMPSYASIMVMGIGQGVFYNPVLCLMNVIMIDSVGQTLFPRAMMITMMTMYGSMVFLPTIFGMLYDQLESYLVPMCIAAGCGILGGILTIVERKTRTKPNNNVLTVETQHGAVDQKTPSIASDWI